VVSAGGHGPDNPRGDLVADLRAATPTDAARRVVPDTVADLRYVDKGEFASYVADEDPAVRAEHKAQFLARQPGSTDADFERLFPPGFFGHRKMLGPEGKYGTWLLTTVAPW